uniref:Uncharacterized protein n=1 Tax=Tanacetum cinerariifolium TaxID=118510 RepID=A0A6L2KXD0_TANCI|nr:hypothetical protein [Tanacetum cinerariifolium]
MENVVSPAKTNTKNHVHTPSNDPLPSGEDRMQLKELMKLCTNLSNKVLDLENKVLDIEKAKTSQAKEISTLKKRVKKLKKRRKSRPDASKQGRSIKDIDQDADITLLMKLRGGCMMHIKVSTADPVTTAGEVVIAASVKDSAAPTTATTADVDDELTLEKTLIAIKAVKPMVISTTATIVTTVSKHQELKVLDIEKAKTSQAKEISTLKKRVKKLKKRRKSRPDKAKVKMIELEKPLKKKDQIALNEEVARKLEAEIKAEMKEEKKIERDKDEANRVVIKEWDDVQATIDANRQTSVHHGAQLKASTDKKSKKKRNHPSLKPKTSKIVKESSLSTQVANAQHAEEPVTTADATKSLDASESAEEQGNQPKTADSKKVLENIVDEAKHTVKEKKDDDEFINSRLKSLGNVTFEELYGNFEESPYDTEFEIKINLDDSSKDTKFQEADPDLESMPEDEIESAIVNVLDELADMANSQNDEINDFAKNPYLSVPLGHLHKDLSSLTSWVEHLESSLAQLSIEEPLSGGLTEVMKGLSKCKASERNVRRIQVKDIIKEVKDYLKTYSLAGMDINWRETQYHLKVRVGWKRIRRKASWRGEDSSWNWEVKGLFWIKDSSKLKP